MEPKLGAIGRVSDTIPEDGTRQGEVMLNGQAFYAQSSDAGQGISKGQRVVVVEYYPPRTVVVTPL